MKRIIILKGVENVGKTAKINQIANWIIDKYKIPNTIGLDIIDFGKDTLGVLKINNLTIGINSQGDDLAGVKKIEELINHEGEYPDIIICACRTRGKGFRYLNDNFNYSQGWLKVIVKVEKYAKTDLLNLTKRDKRIIDELKTWLIGLEK